MLCAGFALTALRHGVVHGSLAAGKAYINESYRREFRITEPMFDKLYARFKGVLDKDNTRMRKSIPGRKKLAVFLSWLARGNDNHTLATIYKISRASIIALQRDMCNEMNKSGGFVQEYIKLPGPVELRGIMDGFQNLCGLPGCCGAMDGTFVAIKAPNDQEKAAWRCYKGYPALLVLAEVDSKGRFIYVDSHNAGAVGDAGVWGRTYLKELVESGDFLKLPQDAQVLTDQGVPISPYILADSAFPLSNQLMKCYETKQVDLTQMHFNYAAIRTRRVVECAFGRLKARWRILQKGPEVKDPLYCANIATICCALHNFCQDEFGVTSGLGTEYFDSMDEFIPSSMRANSHQSRSAARTGALAMRDALAAHVKGRLDLVPARLQDASRHYELSDVLHGPVSSRLDINVPSHSEQATELARQAV
jgi:hypothetical protein